MRDFLSNSDSIDGLCWGYKQFEFARRQPALLRTPFWQAFNLIRSWPGVGVLWNNLVKADYAAPGASWSILQAPEITQETLVTQQASMIVNELAILDPHVCLFLTGPFYDPVIAASFPDYERTTCGNFSKRELTRIVDRSFPERSFRTYHPKFLRMSGRWNYFDYIRNTCALEKS